MPAKLICGSRADAGLLVEAAVAGIVTGVCVGCGVTVPGNTGDSTAIAVDVAAGDLSEGALYAAGVIPASSDCEEVLAATAAGVVLVAGAKLICGSRAACTVA